MGYSNTTIDGSSSYKPTMETGVDKSHFRRPSKIHDMTTHATYSPSLDAGIHISPFSSKNTYTTHT